MIQQTVERLLPVATAGRRLGDDQRALADDDRGAASGVECGATF